jgi:hypothetical protein
VQMSGRGKRRKKRERVPRETFLLLSRDDFDLDLGI